MDALQDHDTLGRSRGKNSARNHEAPAGETGNEEGYFAAEVGVLCSAKLSTDPERAPAGIVFEKVELGR
jgi:hypothetical protein